VLYSINIKQFKDFMNRIPLFSSYDIKVKLGIIMAFLYFLFANIFSISYFSNPSAQSSGGADYLTLILSLPGFILLYPLQILGIMRPLYLLKLPYFLEKFFEGLVLYSLSGLAYFFIGFFIGSIINLFTKKDNNEHIRSKIAWEGFFLFLGISSFVTSLLGRILEKIFFKP